MPLSVPANVTPAAFKVWAETVAGRFDDVHVIDGVGDGVTDDTDAIHDTLAKGGITLLPAGTWLHTGLTLPAGANVYGVGAGFYRTPSPASQRSILKLADGSDAPSITIPDGVSYGRISALEIDGNKNNNAPGGEGILFESAAVAEPQEAGWRLSGIQVYETAGRGIYVGGWRQAVYGEHVLILGAAEHGLHVDGTDSKWVQLLVGQSAFHNVVIGGAITRLMGGDLWSAGESGISVVGEMVSLIGIGIDRNEQHGILIESGARHVAVGAGTALHSNSQAADDTYSDIKVETDSGHVSVANTIFGPLDAGLTNRRKYAIELGTNSALHAANTHDAASTGTAYTDNPSNLSVT